MWKTVVASFVSAVLGGLIVFLALSNTLVADNGQPTTRDSVVRESPGQPVSDRPSNATQIYNSVSSGVVHIRAIFTRERTDFFGFRTQQQAEATGSGFVIDKDGLIVTNAHVVQDSGGVANRITVVLGEDELDARLLGTDPSTDIAVLKVDPGSRKLKVLTLADSSRLDVGDSVYAIGSPFGLEGSMTEGIISALNRTIDSPNPQFRIRGAIQTDAAVNPGNSGGPLINAEGQVVGINTQIASRTGEFSGIAFAIPSNMVKEVVGQIEQKGRASHPWLGISGMEITKSLAETLKLPVENGVMVVQLVPGGPAEKSGLKGATTVIANEQTGQQIPSGGDVITRIDSKKITTMDDILGIVETKRVNDTVRVELYRGAQKQTISLKLGERPQSFTE